MKNIFLVIVIALLLSACAPAAIPPTSTPTPIPPTATPTLTPKPIIYTLRINFLSTSDWSELHIQNPSAIQSVRLVEKQGNLIDFQTRKDFLGIYQSLTGAESLNSVEITVDFEIAGNSSDMSFPLLLEKGAIGNSIIRFYGLHDGSEYLLNEVKHGFVEGNADRNPLNFSFGLETLKDVIAYAIPTLTPSPYSSCVDPELIAKVEADFKTRTGVDLANPVDSLSMRFVEKANSNTGVSFYPETPNILMIGLYKVGAERVPVEGIPGVREYVCVYGRGGTVSGQTISMLAGWIGEDEVYHQFSSVVQGNSPSEGRVTSINREAQLAWIENLPDGAYITVPVHTFNDVDDVSLVNSERDDDGKNVAAVVDFLKRLGGDYLVRMSGLGNGLAKYWEAQDPSKRDPGFIPGGNNWDVRMWLNFQFEQ